MSSTTRRAAPGQPWKVKTYSGTGRRLINLVARDADSDNSVYAQLTSDLGPDKVKETARMMGIKSKLNGYCAESLGGLEDGVSPLEMASAYATIANGGYRNRPRMIKKIVDRDGKTLKLRQALARAPREGLLGRRHLRGDQDPAAEHPGGTGTHANIGCPAAGKTGTTDKNIDAWFVGFTPRLSTAVWVGFPARRGLDERHVRADRRQHRRRHLPGRHLGRVHEAGRGQVLRRLQEADRAVHEPAVPRPLRARGGKDDDKDEDGDDVHDPAPGVGAGNRQPRATTPRAATAGKKPAATTTRRFDPNAYETPPQDARPADPAAGRKLRRGDG